MHALLIYPPFPETFFGFRHALELTGKQAISPPLGLLTVAALLPREWHLRFVDTNVRPLRADDLEWADIAFISVMTLQRAPALDIIARCRAAGVRTVVGGALPTSDPRADLGAEHVIRNEAELTLPPFLRDLARGTPQPVYTTAEFCRLADTPVPRWDLVDLSAYALMDVQCTRGCPYECDFCNAALIGGPRHRLKPVTAVVAELDRLAALGWRGEVFFVDDNLTASPAYLRTELLPALLAWRRRGGVMPFHIQASVTFADDPELLDLLFAAGVNQVFIGIESLDEACLAECGKRQNRGRDLVADVRRIQAGGFTVMAGFIVGFDHDTPDTFARQARFIDECAIVMPVISLLLAPPGTRLHARLAAEGRLGVEGHDGLDGMTNIIPRMGLSQLQDGYHRLVSELYDASHFYGRARRFITMTRRTPATPRVTRDGLRALPRILWRLGVRDDHRRLFWYLLAFTLARRPRMLWFAIMFAVCGYHYRRHCGARQTAGSTAATLQVADVR